MPTAILTFKPLAAPASNMQAAMAGLARVRRIDGHQLDSSFQTLVLQELTQLVERPIIGAPTLSLIPGLLVGPVADARQIFNGDGGVSFYRSSDDCCTDAVILPGLISALFAGQPFQESLGSFCAFPLSRGPSSGELISNVFGLFAAPFISFRSHRNVSATKVDANHLARLLGSWSRVFDLDMDIVLPVSVLTELGRCRLRSSQFASLVASNLKVKSFTPINCSQADRPILLSKREYSGVIVGAGWRKLFDLLLFLLGSFAVSPNPGTNSNRQVRRQTKTTTQLMINLSLNSRFASHFWQYLLIRVVAAIRKRLKSSLNFRGLFRRRLKLANYRQDLFHGLKLVTCEYSTA